MEDDLITLNEHVETGFSAPELENFTKQSEGSVCQNELPESGLGKMTRLYRASGELPLQPRVYCIIGRCGEPVLFG